MSETKTLHRNFWVWEFEKEERWLNEMAQEGWALQNAGFCTYTFEKTEPGQYIIRLAMLDSSPDFESFMGELEAQSVGHCFSWGYFRRSAQLPSAQGVSVHTSLMCRIFRVFKKFIFTRLHSDAGGYIIVISK